MTRSSVLAAVLWQLFGAAPVLAAQASQRVFPVPQKSYALSIDLSACEIAVERANETGTGRYVRAYCPKTGVNVSFWIKPAEKRGDSKICRDTWWRKDSAYVADASMREVGDLAVVDYTIGNEGLKQGNAHAYLAYRDTWIDFHLSRIEQGRGAVEEFDRLLRTVAIVDPNTQAAAAPGTDRSEDVRLGSQYFLKSDYRKAAIYYQKVVDAEKKSRTLDQTTWRVVVDNLAMAYGISGEFDRSAAVLQYGIAEDPKYPMFYYNLACTYAEKNDLPNAIAMLKKAFALKQNMIEGEQIPDPRADSSFEKFLANDAFQKALREIGV